ncbi:MAG: site-2 protease family protein [Candidatus Aureabacteria bacterium]|nr:site-2 protease family protein [Candidatus Auribacterota bacterium]
MDAHDIKLIAVQLRVVLEDIMTIDEALIKRDALVFRGDFIPSAEEAFGWMRERLGRMGFVPMIARRGSSYEVRVVPETYPSPSNPLINLLLFVLTVISTLVVGAGLAGVDLIAQPERFSAGLPFSVSILAILAVHEFGHYLMSSFHGVKATLPYFIPGPTIIGTFGAVIKTKSPVPDRKGLLDIGAAGPICGFIVALVALGVGLSLSEVVDLSPVVKRGVTEFGDSLMTMLMTYFTKGHLPEGKTVMLHPVAFAGWVGLLITAFNLMPVGQLDGGHVLYAVLGRWHSLVARMTIAALLIMGWFLWQGWFLWAFLVILLGPYHAPPLNDVTPLNRGRIIIALLTMVILILCVVPIPITFQGGF